MALSKETFDNNELMELIIMPISKRALFSKILTEDFLAELNFMAGVPHARHPDRLRFMGDAMASLHAAIARPDIITPVEIYDGNIQRKRIAKAARMASALYGQQLDQLTEEQVKSYAISGVDRLFAYLTVPNTHGKWTTPWDSLSYLKGLTSGDARRWMTAVPEQILNNTSVELRPITTDAFYKLASITQQCLFAEIVASHVTPPTVHDNYLTALELDSKTTLERREMDHHLRKMVSAFIKASQQHFAVPKPLPRGMFSSQTTSSTTPPALVNRLKAVFSISDRASIDEGPVTFENTTTEPAQDCLLLAKALWKALYSRETTPRNHLWNSQDWQKSYPGVFPFLSDFLTTSPSRAVDIAYLQKKWLANGALTGWQNAFNNASALVARVNQTTDIQHELALSYAQPITSNSNTTTDMTLKITAVDHFMCIRPHWEMRLLERLKLSQPEIKLAAFGNLGHGAGISPALPHYDKLMTPGIRDDRRYSPMNDIDQRIATGLLTKAHEAISTGDIDTIRYLIPDSWGFYKQDTLLEASRHMDEIDVTRAERQYAERLKTIILAPLNGQPITSQAALARMQNFYIHERELLAQQQRDYLQKCSIDQSWYNQTGIRVTVSDRAVAERLAHYQRTVRARTKILSQWLVTALNQQPIGDLLSQCEAKITAFNQNESSHQEDIITLIQRGAALLENTAQRFAILMNSCASTQAIYQAYTVEQQLTLKQEIDAGDLDAVLKRFNRCFLTETTTALARELNEQIALSTKALFLAWIGGLAPSPILLEVHWRNLKKTWRGDNPECHDARQQQRVLSLPLTKTDKRKAQQQQLLLTLRRAYVNNVALSKNKKKTWREANAESHEAWQQQVLLALSHGDVRKAARLFVLSEGATVYLVPELEKIITQGRTDAIDHCLKQLPSWNTITNENQIAVHQRLQQGAITPVTLSTLLTDYPQALSQPTDDYLKRYLRFGLAVDACDTEQHTTLLFQAIKMLAASENQPRESSENVYRIIQYLINAGATIRISNTEVQLNTPLAYVQAHHELHPENKRWQAIQQALETIVNWLELQEGEDIIFDMINRIYEEVDHYKVMFYASSFNPLRNLISQFNWLLRPREIQIAREKGIRDYPREFEALLMDRFHLKDNLKKLKDQAQASPTRLKMGQLDTGIFKSIETCERQLNAGIPQENSTLTMAPEAKQRRVQNKSSWSETFFGNNNPPFVNPKEAAKKLQVEAITTKGELLTIQKRLARANGLVEQCSEQNNNSIGKSQATAPPAVMTTVSTMHQAHRIPRIPLSQFMPEALAKQAKNSYNVGRKDSK